MIKTDFIKEIETGSYLGPDTNLDINATTKLPVLEEANG